MDKNLQVEYLTTEILIPYANNSRLHSDDQVMQIAESIKAFGFTNPILIDENYSIISGHGRVRAAELLGIDTVPTISLTGLSEEQRRAYIIADNKLALNSGWDYDLLKVELQELDASDVDLMLIGFTDYELLPLLDTDPITNAGDEWGGMPEFNQKDERGYRTLILHFKDEEAVTKFAEVAEIKLTDKTRYIWWPEQDIDHVKDLRYAVEDHAGVGSGYPSTDDINFASSDDES